MSKDAESTLINGCPEGGVSLLALSKLLVGIDVSTKCYFRHRYVEFLFFFLSSAVFDCFTGRQLEIVSSLNHNENANEYRCIPVTKL